MTRYRGSRTSFASRCALADVLLLKHTDALHGASGGVLVVSEARKGGAPEVTIQGVKVCQSVCKQLMHKGQSGLQSRPQRFDSAPSLQHSI